MKTTSAIVLLLIAAVAEPAQAQDLDSDLSIAKCTKECLSWQTATCEATLLEIKAIDANITGGLPELAEIDGVYLELEPHEPAAPFALDVVFRLPSCANPFRPFFLRVVNRADPPLATRIALMNRETKEYDGILETKTYLEQNDHATRIGAPSRYVSEDGRIYLSFSYQLLAAESAGLELRGADRIGIDLDKIEIFE